MGTYRLAELRAKLEELGISPKKALGQNFLINSDAVDRIISAVRALNPKVLIEIGPGLGALTEPLTQFGVPLQLIELDRKVVEYWRQHWPSGIVHEGDALQLDWNEIAKDEGCVLVSNLPYQISASLVIDRSLGPSKISGMVLMFQKEVAQRIVAAADTDDYGLLTVIAQTFWEVRHVLEISSKDFFPPPAVASRVVEFRRRSHGVPAQPERFLKFVKAAFAQRRKFLIKNLESIATREDLVRAFTVVNLEPNVRAENLSPATFQRLFSELQRP